MSRCEGLTKNRLYRISGFRFYFLGHTNYVFTYEDRYISVHSDLTLPLGIPHHPRTVHHFCSTQLRNSCLRRGDLSLTHLYYELKDEKGSPYYYHLFIK